MSKKKRNFIKKYHKWLGIILAFFIILFAISGIVMNHRQTFSGIDVSRNLLPKEFRYKNWNNHALRGSLELNNGSTLVYGNIGVWKTDSLFQKFEDYNQGFNDGIDNKKIYCLAKDSSNSIYAGTHFGLFKRNSFDKWVKITIDVHEERIESLVYKNDSLFALSRSELIIFPEINKNTSYQLLQLPSPEGFKSQTPLFRFLWEIHSGEIFGIVGKLFVDLLGVLMIFLTLSGLLFFFTPKLTKRIKKSYAKRVKEVNKFSIKWHNKLGIWFAGFLIILAFTGMFLRPPLLIAIANSKIGNPPLTKFDSPNPWFDKLRDFTYDKELDNYILYTTEGFFILSPDFDAITIVYQNIPVSVMGLNVFEKINKENYLIGSFSGLFVWNIHSGEVYDYFSGKPYSNKGNANPFGSLAIQGFIQNKDNAYVFDYGSGTIQLTGKDKFPDMPEKIQKTQMSLWNLCLEIHTGRIFRFLIGPFYILYIPLMGLSVLFILITGMILWFRKR